MDEQQAREVARGLREGRTDAWRALYDAFAPRVWCGVARLLGPASADVADVVQETMIAAARSARTYDAASGSLWNWLWGIARLQTALHFRKRQRHDRLKHADWIAAVASVNMSSSAVTATATMEPPRARRSCCCARCL